MFPSLLFVLIVEPRIPGRPKGELWCAIAHLRISRFYDVLHIVVHRYAMPRNDMRVLPHRRALHRRLALGRCDPQLHAGLGLVGVDAELAALEQRLYAAIAEFLRRFATA